MRVGQDLPSQPVAMGLECRAKTSETSPMQTNVAAVDFSKATDSVLNAVGARARMVPSRILLVHTYQPTSMVGLLPSAIEEIGCGEEQAAAERLEQLRMGLENEG